MTHRAMLMTFFGVALIIGNGCVLFISIWTVAPMLQIAVSAVCLIASVFLTLVNADLWARNT